VCAGLKLPQAPVLPQVAVQLMPSLPELAVAAKFAVAPVFSVDEGAVEIEIVIGVAFTTVTVAAAVFVESLVEVALIVIVLPTADEDEARKVAAVPLDV
jgi:hypothetical protein